MKYQTVDELITQKEDVINGLKAGKVWLHHDNQFPNKIKTYLKPNDQLVDLGCGSGFLAERLVSEFNLKNIELVDLDDYRVNNVSQQLVHHHVNFNMEKLPFADQSKDGVFVLQVLEHLENCFLFVREISRILKKDGILFLSVPTGFSIFSRVKFLFKAEIEGFRPEINHISFFPKDIFFKILFKDFELVDKICKQKYLTYKPLYIKYPKNDFFSSKTCYIFKKL